MLQKENNVIYKLYQLDFFNGVHFGNGSLEDTETAFHADTFFSALFQEALKLKKEQEFLLKARNGELIFSDAFPYMGQKYFIPKPIVQTDAGEKRYKGDSAEKKLFKNLRYIPVEYTEDFICGNYPKNHLEDIKRLGKYGMKVSTAVRGNEEPKPYRVHAFYFQEGNGLYVIVRFQDKNAEDLFEKLLESLSYRGLGGKKSSGLGRFAWCGKELPEQFKRRLDLKARKYLLLSAALPEESELVSVLENASYSLIRRGGFVDSETYSAAQMRKEERYVFAAGSCFERAFEGKIAEDKSGGSHPVFRYEKALFLGVNV